MKVQVEEYPVDEHVNDTANVMRMGPPAHQYDVKPGERLYPNGRILIFHDGAPYYDGPMWPGYEPKGTREFTT